MQREPGGLQANSRSLLDRVGGPTGNRAGGSPGRNFKHDEIQARIDNIVNNAPDNSMVMGGFPGMNGMEMNAMANMGNPLLLQEIMMNQMALMAQMASSMGMLNPTTGQFVPPGFPMQGVMPQDPSMFPGGMNNGMQGQMAVANGRGRGGSRPTRGSGRGRGGSVSAPSPSTQKLADAPASEAAAPLKQSVIAAPTPVPAVPTTSTVSPTATTPQHRIPYALPERPQSPTLCKFGLKCTNPHCRYSHPSPVATPESGVVLSNEACEKGKDCKDQDCIKAHVSPAVLNPPGMFNVLLRHLPAYHLLQQRNRRQRRCTTHHMYHHLRFLVGLALLALARIVLFLTRGMSTTTLRVNSALHAPARLALTNIPRVVPYPLLSIVVCQPMLPR